MTIDEAIKIEFNNFYGWNKALWNNGERFFLEDGENYIREKNNQFERGASAKDLSKIAKTSLHSQEVMLEELCKHKRFTIV